MECGWNNFVRAIHKFQETPQFQQIIFKLDALQDEIKQLRIEMAQAKIKPRGALDKLDVLF